MAKATTAKVTRKAKTDGAGFRLAFEARLEAGGPGGGWTVLRLTAAQSREVGRRGHMPVKGAINGFEFRATLGPAGDGTHQLVINRQVRDGAAVKIGDPVRVVLERDTAPRDVVIPDDFRRALAKDAAARRRFESLPPSHQRAYVEAINEAKKPDTRNRRIAGAVSQLAIEARSR